MSEVKAEYRKVRRFRYGRVPETRVPKNTLATVRDKNLIYFGIARCNNKLDTFNKNIGKRIALNRLNLAINEFNISTESFVIHHSGLRGVIDVKSIKALIKYFNDIDTSMLPNYSFTKTVS